MEAEKLTVKLFLNKVLAGVATGIVVGLIPNAILGELFKFLATKMPFFATLLHVVVGIQFTVPVIVGVLIGMQFGFKPLQTVIVGTAAFVGSGAAQFTEAGVMLVGIGDLINTMITASISVLLILYIKNRLGSLTILLLPIIAGGLAGLVGILSLPYVMKITLGLGSIINGFTTLQPIVMSVLISIAFSLLIISPISTVGLATAIGISGLASGAANIGVAAAASMLVIGSLRSNPKGVTMALGLGAMKMMMPNLIRYPIMALPVSIVAAVMGVLAAIFNIQGTKESAGFGYTGLIGPINAFKFMTGSAAMNGLIIVLVYIVATFAVAAVVHWLLCLKLKVYSSDIFKFEDTNG